MKIKTSKGFALKLMSNMFQELNHNWLTSTVSWLIDDKYRTYKQLNKYLEEQVESGRSDGALLYIANKCKGKDVDETIINVLRYVKNNFTYKSDKINWDKTEYWAPVLEILKKKADDCDGLNTMVYVLARLAGVPQYLLYCAIGNVNSGGHFWCIYLSPKTGYKYAIDATYWYDGSSIYRRQKFRLTQEKYQRIWYVFNEEWAFK